MRIVIIVPYFGKLPDYFQIFLDSCAYNSEFTWLVFTDDLSEYRYPQNVQRYEMTFEECRRKIQSRFDFRIALSTPQKLCDYKCAYGYIFRDKIKSYDWWGHCDLDQVFGKLSSFVTEEKLRNYDKIYSLGHLTLYRNSETNNRMFMSTLCGRTRYREVFTTDKGQAFDEWLPGNINEIYQENNGNAWYDNDGADINPYRTSLVTVHYDVQNKCYIHSGINNSIFLWKQGKLYQVYRQSGKIHQKEYPYVHLQKRAMKDMRTDKKNGVFYIIPNRFVDGDLDAGRLLTRSAWRGCINTQYFIVKWKSFLYRVKNGDWEFHSVFRR